MSLPDFIMHPEIREVSLRKTRVILYRETDYLLIEHPEMVQLISKIQDGQLVEFMKYADSEISARLFFLLHSLAEKNIITEAPSDFSESLSPSHLPKTRKLNNLTFHFDEYLPENARDEFVSQFQSSDLAKVTNSTISLMVTDHFLKSSLPEFPTDTVIFIKPFGQLVWISPVYTRSELFEWQEFKEYLSGIIRPSQASSAPEFQIDVDRISKSIIQQIHSYEKSGSSDHLVILNSNTNYSIPVRKPFDSFEKTHQLISAPFVGLLSETRTLLDEPGIGCVLIAQQKSHMKKLLESDQELIYDISASGKGFNREQALVSLTYEAIERHGALYDISRKSDYPIIRSSYSDLENAIHPNDVLCYSKTQFENRDSDGNQLVHPFHRIPEPLGDKKIDWTIWNSMADESEYFFPACLTWFFYPESTPVPGYADSNGLAAGPTLEMAKLNGILELIERDAIAIWWYNQLPVPSAKLSDFRNLKLQRINSYYHSIGRNVQILNLTSDINIPVVGAVSWKNEDPQRIVFGFSAGFDFDNCIEQALLEMNQLLTAVQTEGNSNKINYDDPEGLRWWNEAHINDLPFLTGSGKWIQNKPDINLTNNRQFLTYSLELLCRKNLNCYYFDHSEKFTGTSVAKVIIPGLRPFWRRLSKGRLYLDPKSNHYKKESEMNPFSLFV